METRVREKRERLNFELKSEIKEKHTSKPPRLDSFFNSVNPQANLFVPQTRTVKDGNGNSAQVLDIESMTKQIDKKIEELARKEEEQKKASKNQKADTNTTTDDKTKTGTEKGDKK